MITIAVPQAPADRAPRLAARRELRAAEVPAASARLELERAGGSRSPCRRRLLTDRAPRLAARREADAPQLAARRELHAAEVPAAAALLRAWSLSVRDHDRRAAGAC